KRARLTTRRRLPTIPLAGEHLAEQSKSDARVFRDPSRVRKADSMSTLNASLSKLRQLAPILNKAADDAALVVNQVETFLSECGIGIEADSYEDFRVLSQSDPSLAYRRVNGKYRIAVVEYQCSNPDAEEDQRVWKEERVIAWSEAPRAQKLDTFRLLPKLLSNIVEAAEGLRDHVERTQKIIDELLPLEQADGAPPAQKPESSTTRPMANGRPSRRR